MECQAGLRGNSSAPLCIIFHLTKLLVTKAWILRNFADANYGMLRVSAVFHHCGFLQMVSLLCLLLLVLSGQTPLVVVEDSKLEKIELGAPIHTPFNQL